MRAKQKQQVQAYQRVQDFLAANPPPESPPYTAQKQVLDDVIAKLGEYATDQGAARRMVRGSTRRQWAMRRQLRIVHLAPIAQIARAMVGAYPDMSAALTLPSWNLKTHNLVVAAGEFRKVAAQFEKVFVEAGRPQGFLAALDAAIAALRTTGLGQAGQLGSHVGAREGIEKELKRGRVALELLDAMVTSAFAEDAVALGKWETARRVRAVSGGGVAAAAESASESEVNPAA